MTMQLTKTDPGRAQRPHWAPVKRTRPARADLRACLFALPALIFIVGVVHYSLVANGVYSTWNWSGVTPSHTPVGGSNYIKLVEDPVFWRSLGNTLVFATLTVANQMVLGFMLAVLVRTRTRGRGILRTLLFIPVVISPAIVATSFRLLLTPDGEFNGFLRALGLDGFAQPWLADPRTALLTLVVINVWQYTGYSFVIYDAAMAQIDPSVIEAAHLDGASTFGMLRSVIAPLLSGSHLVLIVLGVISALKTFDLVFLTTAGGPGVETEFLSTYIYRQVITQFSAGYGAALSVALVVIALVFAVLQVRLAQKDAH
ncbi:carbohydrate ABC transporter permease [Herbiconiux sp. A18JL235]|uniref:Carbohydrate ABC transporter permease n=1 Tax=Herbiconiux sp. A18JL235 TaxID=3152363 RepID=A0AB39BGV8_9MICO